MKIIHIEFDHPSFSWGTGLYIFIKQTGEEIQMCQIDDKGQPHLYDNGKFMISVTGKNNPGITETNLTYTP